MKITRDTIIYCIWNRRLEFSDRYGWISGYVGSPTVLRFDFSSHADAQFYIDDNNLSCCEIRRRRVVEMEEEL